MFRNHWQTGQGARAARSLAFLEAAERREQQQTGMALESDRSTAELPGDDLDDDEEDETAQTF